MDTVLKIVDPVIEFVRDHGINQLTYIFCYTKYFEELNKRVKRLGEEKERLDRQRDEAKRKGDIVEDRVEEWFEEVGEFEIRVEKYMNNAGHKKTRGLYYLFPYYRHKLGRQAKKMEPEALRLKDECPKDDEVSHAENVTSFDLTSSYSGYIEFDSRKSIADDIMTKLKDPNMKIIGLHGAQGMGKSTLIKKIANKAKDEGLFDRVAEIDVTVNPNPLTIQADIAHVLDLPLQGESENVRADYLRRWLKIENVSILIVLDNLHERLDLNRLGIPVDLDYDLRKKNELSIMSSNQGTNPNPESKKEAAGGKQDTGGNEQGTGTKVLEKGNFLGDYKGCKVLLSSRDKKVFPRDVGPTFNLKEIDENEALQLFEKVTGEGDKISMPKEEIQNYCTGLPMRIVTFAEAFKNWSESESEPTLEKFKRQGLVEWQKSSETPNKKKYDLPKNKELKFIYLLCAQMGHLPLVNDLVKYCFGLGILEGVSSLSVAREKINESLQELKNLSLVSYENPYIHFHMSHMVRDDALSNALMDHNVFALRDGKLDDWPELESCISISICNSYITDGFPQVINCPQLKFLQIETIDPFLEIPESFFSRMENLRVLILAGFHLSSLPYSIEDLLNLRMLCLERCTLDCNLSILRKFKKLRILSFSGSQLKNLPVELRYLDKLRMLDISDCFKLKIIPPDLFSNLTCLEELYIRKSLIKMLVEKGENKGHNSFLSELKNLHQLKVVDLSIPCVSILPNHLFFDRLKGYKIEIGDVEMFSVGEFRMPNKYEELKVLALQLKDDTDIQSHQGIKLLFKTAQSLFLGNVCVQNVVNELNIDEFQNLKHLSIIKNNDVEYFNSTDLSYCVKIFSNLESLCLYNMMKLKMICRGPITLESFAKLKTIKVEMCCQLENLFSFYAIKISTSTGTSEIFKCNSNMKKFLASLEMIEVCECVSLKEILQIPPDCVKDCECESLKEILQIPQDYGKVEFLKLRTLTLQSLPSFTCFYTKVERSCWPHSIEAQTTNRGHTEISTEQAGHNDNAPPLFGEPVEVPNLENLNLSSLNIRQIWSDKHLSSFYFQNLIKLVVKDCDKLTHLCSLPMASSLKNLKSLVISGCLKMEKIFEIEGISANKVCVFPKLEEIHLNKMKRLTDMWQTEVGIDSFSSLISVRIEECDQLDMIFPSHMEGWFESLINLKVYNCKSVKVIFEVSDSEEIDVSSGIDTNLQVILLENLPKLKELWSKDPDGILNFKKLRTIDVSYCDELRNLFPASVAKDVSKLERMSVLYCERMMEIVSNKDTSEADNDPLEFPELTFVRLYVLPNMKQFYKGRHPIKCPKLKELSMGKCMKLKRFETSDEKFVFSAEAVFPRLEYMEIDFEEAQNWLSNYKMLKLKELIILNSVHRPDLLYPFLYKMPNLEKLKLTSSYSGSLQSTNIGQHDRLRVVLQLKQLLICSSKLKDLGFERDQVLERLELLKLRDCDNLCNLCPSSVSLSYLTCLKLKRCNGLKNLVASSTAKTMVQLKTMKVIDCRQVEQIVSNDGSEEGKGIKIVFSKLISIELVGLMNMTSFCGYKNCEFEFPLLEILIVRTCPKMEKFSERGLIAPKLKDVYGVEGDKKAQWQWEGDLNDTIQEIFHDKVSFAYTEDLELDKFIMEQLWQASGWVQQNSFGYLKRLKVWYCDTLVHVIPSHLLSCFHNLEELDVRDCEAAQVIFNINDEKRVMTKPSGIFRLKILSLDNLPNLDHVWEKDPEGIICLQLLKEMKVDYCERLKSLFPASLATRDLTTLEVINCAELREIFGKDEKVGEGEEGTTQHSAFPSLTTLTLEDLPSLKYSIHCSKQQESTSNLSEGDIQEICIGSRSLPNSYFCLLESLTLDGCEFLTDVLLPFNLLPFLTNLETLEVRNSGFVKIIFDVKCTTQEREVASMGQPLPFSLKKLVVSKLPNLKNVWNEDPQVILSMHHLQEVCVEECEGLTSVFPASYKYLLKLKNVVVKDCKGLMTIFAEDNIDPRTKLELTCPFVRLELEGLPNFKYFYYSSLYCDIFTDLESHTENKVGSEKLLKCLSLGENGVNMILRGEFQPNLLDNIKALTLCLGSDLFGYGILERFPNIEKLVVRDGSFKEIFCSESPNNVLHQLKVLQLESLGELVSIGLDNFWTDSFVRNLETFEVISCSSLENLVACTVCFSNLTCLKVEDCLSLSYLLTSSTAKSLGQLKRMEIKWCRSIEEIVCKEESDEDEIIFPKLSCLNLEWLIKLKSFYKGSLSFPSLEELTVSSCSEMITLCPGTLKVDKLSQVTIDYGEIISFETDLNSIMWEKYLREISRLDLNSSKSELREIWSGSLSIPNFCFRELDTLIVDDCPFLSDAVIPFHLFPLLSKLETLEVRNCDSVKVIFDDVKCSTQHTLISFSMKNLVLSNLPELEAVWNEDPPNGILCMQHLKEVHVNECERLTSVFPAYVAKDLELEELVIEECERLVAIVAEDNTDSSLELTLPCPYVKSLKLDGLQKFSYFYYCSLNTHLESPTQYQLPNEKCLSLGKNGMKMILRGELERNLWDSLKALTLCFGSDVFGYEILEEFPNIEKLVACDGSFKEMFSCESGNNVLQKLKVLQLEYLGELVSIGLENSWTDSFVRNLETFEVIKCWSLKSLVACKKGVSFSNLTCLKVEACYSLSYLFTSSTAKSLGQLKRMEIKGCGSIEEIVCKEESDEDEIIFPQLSSLNLEWLFKLRSFYKGSLNFPSLEELSVTDCKEMITLCVGTVKADKLSQVKLDNFSKAIQLEIDLNSTMRKEFVRKNASKQRVEFRDRTDLQEIWCLALQIPDFCFTYLETLIVNECKLSSDAVLPFTLLPLLPKLETLEVRNCDSVKTIFDVKCAQGTSTFPLKKLVLWKLPNLETVWNEDTHETVTEPNPAHPEGTNLKLTFPDVTSLTLWDLPNFNHNTISCIHDATPTFELIIPSLEDLTVGKNELKMIVDGEFQTNLLHNLKVLGLCFDIECDEFPEYGFLQQLPNVEKLVVFSSCFKVIFCHQRPNNSELLLQLKELRLECLDKLVSIGLENSWTELFVRNLETFEVITCSTLENLVTCRVSFSNLRCLKVENCDGLSYLFTSSTAKSLGRLERMEIENCKSIEEIVLKEEDESDEDEIIFPQLSCLKLHNLVNLRRFYRGNLSFPSLEELSVTHCDDMVTLCPSTLKADKLNQVTIDYQNIPLDTDLNSTTRKEFRRKISELKKLELKTRPKLPEIWHDPLYIPDLCFSELVTLIVKNCQFLSDAVLPFHLLPLLPKLETLEVGKYDSVKTIFDLKRTTKDTVVPLPLPLKRLTLSNLSNLENIWSEDPRGILIMHHLKQVHVKECKGLTSVFPASVAKDLMKLKDLVVEECEGLKAIVAEESKEDEIIFPQLMYLEVESCNSLPYLFTSSTAKSLGELKSMKIKECKSIEEIISKEGEESDEKVEIKFEQLRDLYLEKLDELRCFYAANFTLSFPSLEEVHVINCSSMKTFSASNKIDHSIKWYYSEYARARMETDLNSALHRTSEEEAPDASSAIISVIQ